MNDNFQFRPTRFSILPNVVKNLLIINGVFFLATIAMEMVWGIDLTDMNDLMVQLVENASAYSETRNINYKDLTDEI